MIVRESYARRREQIIAQQAAGTVILLNLADGQYYSLNEVGGRVWELCDGTRSVAEVVSIISQEYEAAVAVIEADVLELLEELGNAQMVVDGDH
jgi:coenzyme PQQ biosynthesis protein PqqD